MCQQDHWQQLKANLITECLQESVAWYALTYLSINTNKQGSECRAYLLNTSLACPYVDCDAPTCTARPQRLTAKTSHCPINMHM